MKVSMTPDAARKHRLCPVSAVMGTEKEQTPFCHGPACGAWRWSIDDVWRAAVVKEGQRTEEKAPYAVASVTVAAKPVSFGLQGRCGLGGPA